MKNNDLKYLSKRKILLSSKGKDETVNSSRVSPSTLDRESFKEQNNERLRQYFMKGREISIDGEPVILKIKSRPLGWVFELQTLSSKENNGGQGQFEVKIDKGMFENQFRGDLERLINKFRYNS